jgi:tetratricopeptide (TPR) repeat protein
MVLAPLPRIRTRLRLPGDSKAVLPPGHRPAAVAWIVLVTVWAIAAPSPRPALAHDALDHLIDEATQRIEVDSTSAAEFLKRGELYRLDHDWDRALADYHRAARLDPSLREVELCRGVLEMDRGQADRARARFDRFLAVEPGNPRALQLRAECWMKLGRPQAAVRDYDRMLEHLDRPTPDHYLARAHAAAACGPRSLDDAVRALDRGIERLGPVVSLELPAVDFELQRRNFDGALARLDRIAPQFGAHQEEVLARRGEVLAAAGRDDEARRAFADALTLIEALPTDRRASPPVSALEARIKEHLAAESIETKPQR